VETLEAAIDLYREIDDQHSLLGVTRSLAYAYENLGNLDRCRELHEDNLNRARELGNRLIEAVTLGALAVNAVRAGRPADALPLLQQNFPIYQELGEQLGTSENLCRTARSLADLRRPTPAVALVACCAAAWEQTGTHVRWVADMNAETLARARVQLDDAAFAEAWEVGRTLTIDEGIAVALDAIASAPANTP
jgi:hypothetical protein